jgi:hypothetical protein
VLNGLKAVLQESVAKDEATTNAVKEVEALRNVANSVTVLLLRGRICLTVGRHFVTALLLGVSTLRWA